MGLSVQIYSLIYSFLFGIILYFLLLTFDRFVMKQKMMIKIIMSAFLVFILAVLYFLGLLYINNGYLHVYFFVLIMVGYIFAYYIRTIWFTRCQEKK